MTPRGQRLICPQLRAADSGCHLGTSAVSTTQGGLGHATYKCLQSSKLYNRENGGRAVSPCLSTGPV